MFKKIILAAATFAIICVAYQIYQAQDDALRHVRRAKPDAALPRASLPRPEATQPAEAPDLTDPALTVQGTKIPSGKAPVFRMYNRRGEAEIIFRSPRWEPISDNEFHMVEPTARLLLPDGQLAYVRADEGQVTVQQGDNSNLNPKRGWFRGHVSIFIDLTKPEWRQANPELAPPERHPETVVKIWLDDVRFDLDLTRLESDGPITLQSARGTLEGRGLTLIWNEVDSRLRLLTIAEGKRATLRNVDLARLNMPNAEAGEPREAKPPGEPAPLPERPPVAERPTPAEQSKKAAKPAVAVRDERLRFLELDDEPENPRENRVDTYRITFRDHVVAEQKEDGYKVIGRLKADLLELLGDFGRKERDALEQSPATQPADVAQAGPSGDTGMASIASGSVIELNWTGRLEIMPTEQEQPADAPAAGDRLHVLARGAPVEIHDRDAGDATCLELEYHAETEQIWLRGSADKWVTLQSGPDQRLTGERIHVDKQARIARIEGPGRLVDRGTSRGDEPLRAMVTGRSDAPSDDTSANVEIAWSRLVEIEFGVSGAPSAAIPSASPIPKGTYLKHAVFDGEVTFTEAGRSIAADHVDVTFLEPPEAADAAERRETMVVDRMAATGHVRMTRETDKAVEHVLCDRLEIEMTLDDTGRRVPKIGRAVGHVVARQVDRPRGGRPVRPEETPVREIRADDEMILELASVPKTITEAERTRYEAAAREQGITPGSGPWLEFEKKLRDRRELRTTRLLARGQVAVQDREQELDLGADSLDCSFGRDEQIDRALIVGRADEPAHVELSDFFIRGPQISLDMTAQSAEVPGAGTLRFLTKQDLDGRAVDDPIPVVVTWEDRMLLDGLKNTGVFTGAAHAVSETLTLDCRELQLRFENLALPPEASASQPAGPDPRWIVGPIVDALRPGGGHGSASSRVSGRLRKRLAYLYAVGDARIQSAGYDEQPVPRQPTVAEWLARLLPGGERLLSDRPAAGPAHLTSRLRLAGPQMAIDLVNEYLVVEGAGNLLVEDYRPPQARRASRAGTSGSGLLTGSSVASLDSLGPSQTLFKWGNSMSFLNKRNVAVFDHQVDMTHRAGSKMAERDRLAAAMSIDPAKLDQLEGREADLTCDNLVVEFERGARRDDSDSSPLSRATRLKDFRAAGRVHLAEGNRFVTGTLVSYSGDSGIGRVLGSPQLPAKLGVKNERTGRTAISSVETFKWNQRTGLIEVTGSSVLATGE